MKTIPILLVACLTIAVPTQGQTTPELITQGRNFLTQSNLVAAHQKFAAAVTASPADPTANVLTAITRLLVLPNQPAGSNFLNRLGFTPGGRNLYAWTSSIPDSVKSEAGNPTGLTNTTEIIEQVQSNILPALAASSANLERVTDRNFVLQLSSAETQGDDVAIDWGDLQIVRAGLSALEYLGHTLSTWNLSMQWDAIQALTKDGSPAFGGVLQRYPQLLNFQDSNKLTPGRIAFTRAIDAYLAGSLFIRQRPLSVSRLFNLDEEMLVKERGFRTTLEDLRASLDTPVALRESPGLTLDATRHFDTSRSFRAMLPQFRGRGILADSLPDRTFNGLIEGLTSAEIDRALSGSWEIEPHLRLSAGGTAQTLRLSLAAQPGQNFQLLHSEDLVSWKPIGVSVVYDSPLQLPLPATHVLANSDAAYYQVAEQLHAVNDDFRNRIQLPSSGGEFYASYALATREPDEPADATMDFMNSTIWWTWTAPISGWLQVESINSYSPVAAYTGSTLQQLIPAERLSPYDSVFRISEGTTYQIVMAGDFASDSQSRFSLRALPPVANDNFSNRRTILAGEQLITASNVGTTREPGEPMHIPFGDPENRRSVWFTWTAPKTGRFTLEVPPNQDQPFFAIYTGETLATLNRVQETADPSRATVLDVTAGTQYQIAIDHFYGTTFRFRLVETPAPANDSFAQAQVLSGTELTVTASNRGATTENGEMGLSGFSQPGHSLWYSWVAPKNGILRLSAVGGDFDALVEVYTGNSLSSLEYVQRGEGGIADYRPVQAGVRYLITVDSYNGNTGTFFLKLWLESIPF